MNILLQFFARYPASIICYLLYTAYCCREVQLDFEFRERLLHRKPGESGIMLGGEAIGILGFGLIFITGIFILVCFANAIARKKNAFYLWLSGIILVQSIIVFNL